ncbi:MAG: PadR family transcriptional regulator [Nitrososphaerales archaeon]
MKDAPKTLAGSLGTDEIRPRIQVARQLVDIEILYLLNFGSKSGYDLRKNLSRSFGIKVSYGTLYPHLHALERSNLITGTWSQKKEQSLEPSLKKRVYDLTSHGGIILKESIERLFTTAMTMRFLLDKVDLRQRNAPTSQSNEPVIRSIESILSKHDSHLEKECVEMGTTGLVHQLELLARSKDGKKTIIRVNDSTDRFDIDQVSKTFAISNDIQARAVLLACPPLSKEVSDLWKFYQMRVFEGEDWQTVLANFDLKFDE